MSALMEAARLHASLLGSLLLSVLLFLVLPAPADGTSRFLFAWCAFVVGYVVAGAWRLAYGGPDHIRENASKLDDSAPIILLLSLAAAVASFIAVFGELNGVNAMPDGVRHFHLALTAATIVVSWLFVQAIYAVHYANQYYGADGSGHERRGLDFGEAAEPDYWDFVYFSITVGATSQTSDVAVVSKRMRRTVIIHAVFAFLFNTTVLALAINIGASLIGT
jgi:uncharacterized membrane protein